MKIVSQKLKKFQPKQVVHRAKIEKSIEKNPDLIYEFIQNILIAQQQARTGKLEAYVFDKN